jgi:hypothetical protein
LGTVGQHVQVLLERNADVNAQSPSYRNTLYAASERGNGQLVKLLLNKNTDATRRAESTATHPRRLQREATSRW